MRVEIFTPTGSTPPKGAKARRAAPPTKAKPFKSVDELLEGARQMFRAREEALAQGPAGEAGELQGRGRGRALRQQAASRWTQYWHRSFKLTGSKLLLCRTAAKQRLNSIEREILTALVLDRLALLHREVRTPGGMLDLLGISGVKAVEVMRYLSEQGRLHKVKLIAYEDDDEDLRERVLVVDPVLVDCVLEQRGVSEARWPVKTEQEFHVYLRRFTRTLNRKCEVLEEVLQGFPSGASFFKYSRRAEELYRTLTRTLKRFPAWRLNRLLSNPEASWCDEEKAILLTLFAKEQGYITGDDSLFHGRGLARATSSSCLDIERGLCCLRSDKPLVAQGYIQPCAASDVLLNDDPKTLEETEFELTRKSLELSGIEKKAVERSNADCRVRAAGTRLDQLVLSGKVKQALLMARSQVNHGRTLLDDWGLKEMIPYGRSVTFLFSGPPGVGKTACAEALAHELGKPILVADYSQIQNCLVGMTEKNIVRVFQQAKQNDAVLFWDEADAMFFDRDGARHNWEVRDVNVLLVELERFEGVCVLATNRRIVLDKALQRRVSLKVEFEPPDEPMRRAIWDRMLPARLPLSRAIDPARLSRAELTGGEIKNVILNAARLALCRSARGPVMMHDFERAIAMEKGRGWLDEAREPIGF